MNNPFESEGTPSFNYAKYLRNQVSDLQINESKYVFSDARSQSKFNGTLSICIKERRFSTRKDSDSDSGYWVKRVK